MTKKRPKNKTQKEFRFENQKKDYNPKQTKEPIPSMRDIL